MGYPLTLPKGSALEIYAPDPLLTPTADTTSQWRKISEHNRSPITVTSNRIEKAERMSNGTLRKFFVADKKNFNVSWTVLPSYRTETVDGQWGAEDLREFYKSSLGQGVFKIRFRFSKDGSTTATYEPDSNGYTVVFSDCTFTLNRRAVNAFWDVSISFEEV